MVIGLLWFMVCYVYMIVGLCVKQLSFSGVFNILLGKRLFRNVFFSFLFLKINLVFVRLFMKNSLKEKM